MTQAGGVYTLDGTDDRCGAGQAASAQGLAFLNPNGTIGFGVTMVQPGAVPVHPRSDNPRSGSWCGRGDRQRQLLQMFGTGSLPSKVSAREIVTGDFNHDGYLDLVIAGHGYDASPGPGEPNVLLNSNADGRYTDQSSTLPQTQIFPTPRAWAISTGTAISIFAC